MSEDRAEVEAEVEFVDVEGKVLLEVVLEMVTFGSSEVVVVTWHTGSSGSSKLVY